MTVDVEFYRRTIYVPMDNEEKHLRRISVFDIHPDGATRTIVFVHGYGGNALQWLYQLRFFGQTMHVIAPEMRGHGLSDDPETLPYTMDGLVLDLEETLDALAVPRPFALIAHSFGGAIATEYALRHPEDVTSLVLIGVPANFVVQRAASHLMGVPDPIFSRAAKLIGVALYASQHTLKALLDHVMNKWHGEERFSQLRLPTLVVLGQRDTVFLREQYEIVPRIIPGAHTVVIPVSAHLVQLERPDAVNRAIRRFIVAALPEAQESEKQSIAQREHIATFTRLSEMLWLQQYDRDVPEMLPQPRQLLHDMVSNAARLFPGRPAIIFFGQKIRYRELDRLSNRFAHALRSLGIHKGDRVAVVLPNIPQYIVAFYGILKAGAIVVVGNPIFNEAEIAGQLQDSGAQVLLTLSTYRPVVEQVCAATNVKHVIYTDVREYLPMMQRVLLASLIEGIEPHAKVGVAPLADSKEDKGARNNKSVQEHTFQHLLRRQPVTVLDSETTIADLAMILYTSGTTDTPKGVMLSHGNAIMNVTQTRHWISDAQRGHEVLLCVLPLSHSYGITTCMNTAIGLAASLVLLPTTRTDQILAAIKKERPSIFPGIPAFYLAIANYPRVRSFGVSSIRTCISGSAPLPVEVQEAFEKLTRGRLVEGYGLTEAAPTTHSNPLKGERRVGSIGIPLPNTQARIVDIRTSELLPPGEVGELIVRGPQVMQGYWNMPAETEKTLRDGWLHTGDLASMDEEGFFTIVDRKKDLILSGAYNVYPRDVEEVLYEHPKVLEAAVVNTTANGGNAANAANDASPFIKAVVVLKRGEKATADELLALCRERLDAYKVPKQIEFRTELPKNTVGKVLRRLLIEA